MRKKVYAFSVPAFERKKSEKRRVYEKEERGGKSKRSREERKGAMSECERERERERERL